MSLKTLLHEHRITHRELAAAIGISRTAVSLIVNHDTWPARDRAALRQAVDAFLLARGIAPAKEMAPKRANAPEPVVPPTSSEETNPMLLRKCPLSMEARRHFRLARDPFTECRSVAEIFLWPDARIVREAMWQTSRHGGFLAVVGESGAGKSTLREELLDRITREDAPIAVAQPFTLAMEPDDKVGKTLRSQHLAECVMRKVAPLAPMRSSPDARFDQLERELIDSARTGMRHVLLIEEAHCIPTPTLRHLKRYTELKDGLRPLLSVILVGQQELVKKIDQVREVAQRIEIVQLPPLDAQLRPYLEHRFASVGSALEQVIEANAVDAITSRLSHQGVSTLYPLAVNNLLARAMNVAATLGVPKVTGELVREGSR